MYRVNTDDEAMAQIDALPVAAALGYAEALGVMKLVPWNGLPLNKANPDGAVRQLIFGPGGYGTVTYLILEDQQRVDVLRVQWAGRFLCAIARSGSMDRIEDGWAQSLQVT